MKIKCYLVIVLVVIGFQTKMAYADERPIITLSYGTPYLVCDDVKCGPSFIIKIFEDGLVQYKGVKNVEVLGSDEHRIDKSAIEKLIKKFQKAHFLDVIGSVDPSLLPTGWKDRDSWRFVPGIRFRQGSQERTVYGVQCELVNEILNATDAKRWELDWIHMRFGC